MKMAVGLGLTGLTQKVRDDGLYGEKRGMRANECTVDMVQDRLTSRGRDHAELIRRLWVVYFEGEVAK